MARMPRILRYGAFAAMVLFGLLGAAFVAGETFDDPGGWAAVGMTAAWLLPLACLSALAVRRPAAAGPVFVVITALASLFTVADSALDIVPRDELGPVAAIVMFALGVSLAFLGLRRPLLAGFLMVVGGLAQLAANLIVVAVRATGDAPGPGSVLGGSSGVVIVPLLVVGLMFVLAGWLGGEPAALRATTVQAHCDTLEGPAVKDGQRALETGNINYALKWIPADGEPELRDVFDKARRVRTLGAEAAELADRLFLETLVRIHRMGEGVGFTGLQPIGTAVDPVVKAADEAIARGTDADLLALVPRERRAELDRRFHAALALKNFDVDDVAAGRRYLVAYVSFFTFAEGEEHEHHEHAGHEHAGHEHGDAHARH